MDTEANISWYRSPIDKDLLRELTERSDWQGFKQVGMHFLLVICTGAITFYAWRQHAWLLMVVALYFHGMFASFLAMGVAGHELQHRTVFKTRFWNEFFCWVVAIFGWSNFVHYRTSHAKHHKFTVYSMLDLEEVLPKQMRKGEWFWSMTLHLPGIYRSFLNVVRLSAGRLSGEWENRIFPASDPELRRKLFNCSRVVLASQVVMAAVFITFDLWIMFFIVTFAPFIATTLSLLCYFPQHAGLPSDVPDFRLNSRTMTLSPFVSFLYWRMNYHVEHHMYAAVPLYNLPKL
ncbi:MAG: fatty acid desaturase, partial [Verrucomicrobia bacterium]|nr:fatty acid desaturase [Verrucomicrobiota bacterium]